MNMRTASRSMAGGRSAAESDHADGHAMLGHCLENGWGTERDLSTAVAHYRRAAALGMPAR